MANTILERIQERYPGKADDARNIAEAMAMVCGTGGRGAGAIADNVLKSFSVLYYRNVSGTVEPPVTKPVPEGWEVDLTLTPEAFGWTVPEGKTFAGWGSSASSTEPIEAPLYANINKQIYAIWVDAE